MMILNFLFAYPLTLNSKLVQMQAEREHLLEVAKRAVEIAIEENEVMAMSYIEKNC